MTLLLLTLSDYNEDFKSGMMCGLNSVELTARRGNLSISDSFETGANKLPYQRNSPHPSFFQ